MNTDNQVTVLSEPVPYDRLVLLDSPWVTFLLCSILFLLGIREAWRGMMSWAVYGRAILLTVSIAFLTNVCALAWSIQSICSEWAGHGSPKTSLTAILVFSSGTLWEFALLLPSIVFGLVCAFILSLLFDRARLKGNLR